MKNKTFLFLLTVIPLLLVAFCAYFFNDVFRASVTSEPVVARNDSIVSPFNDEPRSVGSTTPQAESNERKGTVVGTDGNKITAKTGGAPKSTPVSDKGETEHRDSEAPARRVFGKNAPFTLDELPEGELKKKLITLQPTARKTAMKKLHSFTFQSFDAASHLRSDNHGGIFYVCPDAKGNCSGHVHESDSSAMATVASAGGTATSYASDPPIEGASIPSSRPPVYHSKPGAPNVIYIDFNGARVGGTAWNDTFLANANYVWDCEPWSLDGDETRFSDDEQADIRRIWERVAEDYAPFDVDVTTNTSFDPDVYTGDKNRVGWILITPTRDKNGVDCPHLGTGGIAYVSVFGEPDYHSQYQPAWVVPQSPAESAEAASHEMGHNLSLSHDGSPADAYYSGHGSGNVSWAPIMGVGYGKNVVQWSKGEYTNYSNPKVGTPGYQSTDDDLVAISGYLSYRADDHSDAFATATEWKDGDGEIYQRGIVERTNNADYFTFKHNASGAVNIQAKPYLCDTETRGGNLDIALALYEAGNLTTPVATSNSVAAATDASIINTALPAGTYYLVLKPEGYGSPPANGYSTYASLGQYTITGFYEPESIPEITVAGPLNGTNSVNPVPIVNGDITPDGTDGTDFGNVSVGNSVSHVFTISSDGGQPLDLGPAPTVYLSPSSGTEFTIPNPPGVQTLNPGSKITFTITFAPTVDYGQEATVVVASNDLNEGLYEFKIRANSGAITITTTTYTVSYDGNGNTGGTPPADQIKSSSSSLSLASNTGNLVKTGFTFMGWNTAADGTGIDYAQGATYTTNSDLLLYAKWQSGTVTPPGGGGGGGGGSLGPVDYSAYGTSDSSKCSIGSSNGIGFLLPLILVVMMVGTARMRRCKSD